MHGVIIRVAMCCVKKNEERCFMNYGSSEVLSVSYLINR